MAATTNTDRFGWGSWRFSLRDLLIGTLGVGIALGIGRLTGAAWQHQLLCAYAVWFAAGSWSQAIAIGRTIPGQSALDPSAGEALWRAQLARWIAPLAVGSATMLLIAHDLRWEALRNFDIDYGVAEGLAVALLVLPILTLSAAPRVGAIQSHSLWSTITQSLAMVAAFVLAVVIACDLFAITMLVHVAIEGVLSAIPLRRRGVMTGTPPLDAATRQLFSSGAIAAMMLWWTTLALARGTMRLCPAHVLWRWSALGLSVASVLLVWLTVWGGATFCRRISPLLGQTIFTGATAVPWIACAVVAYVVMWATPLLMVGSHETRTVAVTVRSERRRFLHEWWAVLCLPAIWFVIRLGDLYQQELWRFIAGQVRLTWADLGYYLQDRVNWFGTAYFLALCVVAWRRWRGRDEPGVLVVVPRPRMTIAAAALGTLVLVVTAPPILMWLGFVLWTWPERLPGEAWLTSGS